MFTSFFFLLRARGLKIQLDEWMSFLEALTLGLHNFSIMGFYSLCRCTLVKRETDYDLFDQVFLEFFGELAMGEEEREIPDELWDWLNNPAGEGLSRIEMLQKLLENQNENMEDIIERFEKVLREQTERHDGGSKWIGTNGYTPFGNSGKRVGGMRIGGQSQYRSAFMVAGERRFKDFSKDRVLDVRQFQVAFRKLRQLSEQAADAKTEFDIDDTIRETGDNAGRLSIVYKRPRKNSIKLLLLMDCGGSMTYYSSLCNTLFQAAEKSNIFKDLKVYYFHNCIYEKVYEKPTLRDAGIPIERLYGMIDSEYKVIFVGDAMMAPDELFYKQYFWRTRTYGKVTGIDRLMEFKERYPHIIWLNPQPREDVMDYWAQTYDILAKRFDMYLLSVSGLERGIKQLLSKTLR